MSVIKSVKPVSLSASSATAYKNGKPFYTLEPIVIVEEMNFTFRLRETTQEKLKQELEAKI